MGRRALSKFFYNKEFLAACQKTVPFSPYKLANFKTQQLNLREVQIHIFLNSHLRVWLARCLEGISHCAKFCYFLILLISHSAKPEMFICALILRKEVVRGRIQSF